MQTERLFLNLNFCTITRLNNGDYLLLSVHGGDSAAKHFLCAGASLLALAVGAALFAINLSKRITKTLITPLQGIAEHADGSEFAVPFDELKPFVETLKQRQAAKTIWNRCGRNSRQMFRMS